MVLHDFPLNILEANGQQLSSGSSIILSSTQSLGFLSSGSLISLQGIAGWRRDEKSCEKSGCLAHVSLGDCGVSWGVIAWNHLHPTLKDASHEPARFMTKWMNHCKIGYINCGEASTPYQPYHWSSVMNTLRSYGFTCSSKRLSRSWVMLGPVSELPVLGS